MADLALRRDDLADLAELGAMLRDSGMFDEVHSVAQAAVKVLAGREIGLGPVESMRSFHVIGKAVEPNADLLARLVRRHPRYDYRVVRLEADGCTIRFYVDGEHVGDSTFTELDRERADLSLKTSKGQPSPWAKFPRNMMFARAMTNGVGWYCPDVIDVIRPEAPPAMPHEPPSAGEAEAAAGGASALPSSAVEAVSTTVGHAPATVTVSIDPAAVIGSNEPDAKPEPDATTPAGEGGPGSTGAASPDDPAGAADSEGGASVDPPGATAPSEPTSGEVGSTVEPDALGEGATEHEGPTAPEHRDDIVDVTEEVCAALGGIGKVAAYCKAYHREWGIRSYSDVTTDQWHELRAELRERRAS
jgi:hypothetical protein